MKQRHARSENLFGRKPKFPALRFQGDSDAPSSSSWTATARTEPDVEKPSQLLQKQCAPLYKADAD